MQSASSSARRLRCSSRARAWARSCAASGNKVQDGHANPANTTRTGPAPAPALDPVSDPFVSGPPADADRRERVFPDVVDVVNAPEGGDRPDVSSSSKDPPRWSTCRVEPTDYRYPAKRRSSSASKHAKAVAARRPRGPPSSRLDARELGPVEATVTGQISGRAVQTRPRCSSRAGTRSPRSRAEGPDLLA